MRDERAGVDNLLLLDTGDALTGGGRLGEATRGEGVVAGMNLMDYDAMALGPRELVIGPDELADRLAEAEFPVVSANARHAETGTLVAQPYTVVDSDGWLVGLVGLTREPDTPLDGFEVDDPATALEAILPEVVEQSHAIVLLTNLSVPDALVLADGFDDVDLVVAATPERVYFTPLRTENTDTMAIAAERASARHTGRYVGRLSFTLTPDGAVANETWTTVSMGPEIADDPEMASLLDGYQVGVRPAGAAIPVPTNSSP